MLHNAALRDFRIGDPIEPIKRDAASIATLTERLAFMVGQLQANIASEIRRPRLGDYETHNQHRPVVSCHQPSEALADSEGGECA